MSFGRYVAVGLAVLAVELAVLSLVILYGPR
jgi:hypothetical protein